MCLQRVRIFKRCIAFMTIIFFIPWKTNKINNDIYTFMMVYELTENLPVMLTGVKNGILKIANKSWENHNKSSFPFSTSFVISK